MSNKICQSCGMPITSNDQLGTNSDGSINHDYCKYCYKDGKFIDDISMEEYIAKCLPFWQQTGMSKEQYLKHMQKLFPTLKRWKAKN